MANYDSNILIQNVRKLMQKNNITQQQLANILGISQPNVSKALSESDKKCFTLDQVIGISKHFRVSIDTLVGNFQEHTRDISPRAVSEYLIRLIEHDDVKFFKHSVTEEIHDVRYNTDTGVPQYMHWKMPIEYDAFYFPSYWSIPDGISDDEACELYSEMTQCGNESKHYQTNNFLHQFLQIHRIYQQKMLEKETYQIVVSDLLEHLP